MSLEMAPGDERANHPLNEPASLGALVEYGEGAVVSRTLEKRKTGTLTLFAFDRGQGLSEHTAPFDATVFVLEGRAEITVGGTKHEVAAGRALRMPAGVPHGLHAPERFKMLLVMIRE